MKKLLFVLLLLSGLAVAQSQPGTDLNWTASATAGVAYNVYRAPCTGTISGSTCSADGTFSVIGTVSVGVLAFADNVVTRGASYDYYVTAVCPTGGCPNGEVGESVASNHWAGTIPKIAPGPASSLSGKVR